MKRNSLRLFMLLFIGCCATSLFYSCSKDEVIKSHMLETEMVKFKTLEEYHDALNTVLSMSKNERKTYEKSKGYISFGRKCDEFYDEIDFDKFESLEEIKAFAASNDLIVLYEDDDGEFILETMLSSNSNRYFINSARLFQIGDYVYKVFEDGTAATHISNIHKLVQIKSYSVCSVPEDVEIVISHRNYRNSSSLKSAEGNCGTYQYHAKSVDNYRVGIELSNHLFHGGGFFTQGIWVPRYTAYYAAYTLKSFRKKLGVWAYSKRNLAHEVRVRTGYFDPTVSAWKEFYYDKLETSREVDGTYTNQFYSTSFGSDWVTTNHHFVAYDCFVSMNNHPGLIATGGCNWHLLPPRISVSQDSEDEENW
jgi:hypothetical protein